MPKDAKITYNINLISINVTMITSRATDNSHRKYLSSYGHKGNMTPIMISASTIMKYIFLD